MKVQEIMERASITQSGRAVMYIKEALSEIAITAPTHIKTARIDIIAGKRFYDIPHEAEEILDVRCLNHNNNNSEYRTIPRSVYEPFTEDSDGF